MQRDHRNQGVLRPRSRVLALATIASCALLSSACEKIDPDEVGDHAVETVKQHLTGLAEAISVLDRVDSTWAVIDWLEDESYNGGDPGDDWGDDYRDERPPIGEELEMFSSELTSELERRIFVEDNIESIRRGKITYLLDPALVCGLDGGGSDTECIKMLTAVPVRLVAFWAGDGALVIELHIGDEKLRPIDLTLHSEYISITVDLGDMVRSAMAFAAAAGEDADVDFTVEGKLAMKIAVEGADGYSVTHSILEKVDVAMAPRNDPQHFRVQLGAAPEASRTFLSPSEASFSLAMGSIDIAVARDLLHGGGEYVCDETNEWECEWVEPEAPLTGIFDLHSSGLYGSTTLRPEDDALVLTGLGLGDGAASISYNSLPLFILDLNEEDGRSLDLTAFEDEGDLVLSFSPSMSLRLQHDLTSLIADTGDEVPSWLLGGFTALVLDGALDPMLRIFRQERSDWDDNGWENESDPEPEVLLQVLEGTLTLDASVLPEPVVVSAPSCVLAFDEDLGEDEEPHPFELLGAGDCD